jgi:hypothetical protein
MYPEIVSRAEQVAKEDRKNHLTGTVEVSSISVYIYAHLKGRHCCVVYRLLSIVYCLVV